MRSVDSPALMRRSISASVTMISEFATDAFTASDSLCGIGLDLFLGENYRGYNPEIFPDYIRRQFTPNYVPVRMAKALATDIVGQTNGKRLIDRMIQNGKMLYIVDCLLPYTPDSLKMGYTKAQMEGCFYNEAEAWARILDEKLLFSTEFDRWRKLVTPSPNAPIIYTEAPGEMGNWIGLRILQSYMKRHPNTKIQDLLAMTDVQKLMEAADTTTIIVNPVIYAEISIRFETAAELDVFLSPDPLWSWAIIPSGPVSPKPSE